MSLPHTGTDPGLRCKLCKEPLLDCTCGTGKLRVLRLVLAGKRSPFADCFKMARPIRARRAVGCTFERLSFPRGA